MTRRRLIGVLGALLLASCASTASVTATPSPTRPPASAATPAASPVSLRDARALTSDWLYIGAVAISPRYVFWAGVESGDARQDPQTLMVRDRSSGSTRVLARAPQPAGLVGWLRSSDNWVVWTDYTDRSQISDWTIRAVYLPGGAPVTLLSAPKDAGLADRPEFALDGDSIVVTTRLETGSPPQVLLINCATGERRTLLRAGAGESFGWPAFNGRSVVVESHQGTTDRLLIWPDISSSMTRTLGDASAPLSEPALAGDWLGFKEGHRFEDGRFGLVNLADQARSSLPTSAEAPVGAGSVFIWNSLGAPLVQGVNARTGGRFTYALQNASLRLMAQDGATAAFIAVGFEGERRDQVWLLGLGQ